MAKKLLTERTINILVPVLSVIFGLLVGAIVMLVSGYDPIVGYSALWTGMFGSASAIGETLRTMIPLILAGLSVAFAFRTGLFNIGVEGQLLVGWLAAVRLCSLTTSFPSYSIIYFICSIGGRNLGLHSGIFKREVSSE